MFNFDDIAPCPFCGNTHNNQPINNSGYYVLCHHCRSRGPLVMSLGDNDASCKSAIEAWNKAALNVKAQ